MARRVVTVISVAAAIAAFAPTANAAPYGALQQLSGTNSCLTGDGSLGGTAGVCTAASEMNEANSMLISPDGRFAYVNGFRNGQYNVLTFGRDPATGVLSPLSGSDFCVTGDGSGSGGASTCTNGRNLGYSREGDSLAMTSDGGFLYVGEGYGRQGVAIFKRDAATGKLTQLPGTDGCVSKDGSSEDGADTCANGRMLDQVHAVTLSPDERFVYVTSSTLPAGTNWAGVAIFSRNTTTGVLTQLSGTDACATFNGKSEDGDNTCTDIRGGAYAGSFSITPDGKHAYLPDFDNSSVAILNVDATTGKLSQAGGTAGCISKDGNSSDGATTCQDKGVLDGAWTTQVSPDGKTLVVADYSAPGIASFRVDPATGALTPLAGTDHCITDTGNSSEGTGTCQDGRGFDGPERITMTRDGATLYVGSYGKGVAFVTLDPATGRLAQPAGTGGCYTFDGSSADGAGTCADINASSGGFRLALSPDELFAYLPSDGGTGGSITAFSRQVPPTCTNVAGTTPFQTAFGLTLACSDPNGDAITREIVAQPAHGTLGVLDQASGGVSFAPANGFSGFDSFSFRATDSASLSSAPATASVTVGAAPPTPPTPAPTALDKTAPGCTRSGGKTLSLRTLTVTLRCNEAATVSLKLTLPAAVAKKLKIAKVVAIATGKASLRADVSAKIKLKLTKKAKKRLGKLRAAKLKKLRPTLTYTASDAAGNRAAKSVKLKLKR